MNALRERRLSTKPIDAWGWVAIVSLGLLAVYASILISAARQGLWIVNAHGGLAQGDFCEFWGAGRLALHGRAADVYNWPILRTFLDAHSSGAFAKGSLPFFYPPFLLLLLAPLMAAPPVVAASLWLGGGYLAYLGAMRLIVQRPAALLAAAAAPAAFLVVSFGQNGLLSAALLGAGLALLDRRPAVAGVLIGLFAYKPQFGVLLPLVLVLTGRWRVVISATATVAMLCLASGLVFGWNIFSVFLAATKVSGGHVPAVGLQSPTKLQSLYGLSLTLGLAAPIAWVVQLASAAATAILNVRLWRSRAGYELKAAGLAASVLLVSPYSGVYDLTLLIVAMAFLIAGSWRLTPIAMFGLLLVYFAPLTFAFAPFPTGPIASAVLLAVVIQRWRSGEGRVGGLDQI